MKDDEKIPLDPPKLDGEVWRGTVFGRPVAVAIRGGVSLARWLGAMGTKWICADTPEQSVIFEAWAFAERARANAALAERDEAREHARWACAELEAAKRGEEVCEREVDAAEAERDAAIARAARAERIAAEPLHGHGVLCYYCGKPCNALAANPSEWPISLCHEDDPGVVKSHHVGCVSDRLRVAAAREKRLRTALESMLAVCRGQMFVMEPTAFVRAEQIVLRALDADG